MFGIGFPELILILVIGLVVFGPGKLPEVGRAVGKGIREFKKATSDLTNMTDLDEVTKSKGINPTPPNPANPQQPAVPPLFIKEEQAPATDTTPTKETPTTETPPAATTNSDVNTVATADTTIPKNTVTTTEEQSTATGTVQNDEADTGAKGK